MPVKGLMPGLMEVGKIKIVSMDRGSAVLHYIEEGVIDASIAQQTALMPPIIV